MLGRLKENLLRRNAALDSFNLGLCGYITGYTEIGKGFKHEQR